MKLRIRRSQSCVSQPTAIRKSTIIVEIAVTASDAWPVSVQWVDPHDYMCASSYHGLLHGVLHSAIPI